MARCRVVGILGHLCAYLRQVGFLVRLEVVASGRPFCASSAGRRGEIEWTGRLLEHGLLGTVMVPRFQTLLAPD